MPKYMISGSYTAQAMAGMVASPEDRSQVARTAAEEAGGKLDAFYWAFGPDDFIAIADLPDDVAAGAVSVGVSSGGALTGVKTVKLLTMEEAKSILQKAQRVRSMYRPAGSS